MFLLDTVAVSDTSKVESHPGMVRFLSHCDPSTLYISVVSIGELRYGCAVLPDGRRRSGLEVWIDETEKAFGNRVLDVNADVARIWGELRAAVKKDGFTIALPDLLIAATALAYDLTVVTRNTRDYAPTGCRLINPWDENQSQQ